MRTPPSVMACCLLASCAQIVGIHDHQSSDAGGAIMFDAATDSGVAAGSCSLGPQPGTCASSLAAGLGESCTIVGGDLYCWGHGLEGSSQSGSAVDLTNGSLPAVTAVALSTTRDLYGSDVGTTCYANSSGTWCWGNDSSAQAGSVPATAFVQQPMNITSAARGSRSAAIMCARSAARAFRAGASATSTSSTAAVRQAGATACARRGRSCRRTTIPSPRSRRGARTPAS